MSWSFGDIYDAIGERSRDDHVALIHAGPGGSEGVEISWPEFHARTNCLASYLGECGLQPDAKVAHYMRTVLRIQKRWSRVSREDSSM